MSRSWTRRHLTAAAVTAALLLGGCGIQQTEVIAAGGPATIQYLQRASDETLIFFRLPDGQLAPVGLGQVRMGVGMSRWQVGQAPFQVARSVWSSRTTW
ncbi:hypothetical protein [Streptomyces sp. 058-1L]|uniref:hypothetical protein n=1 Tax=Streptomyces sp. 058-1L TaxID=2789266 RepID=UPI0039807B0A